jgi:hypothetical protein
LSTTTKLRPLADGGSYCGFFAHGPEFELFVDLLEVGFLLGCLPKIALLIYDNVSEVSRYLGQGSTLTATFPLLSRILLVTSESSTLVVQKVERRSIRRLVDGGWGRRRYVLREENNATPGTFFCNDSKSKQLSRYKSFGSKKTILLQRTGSIPSFSATELPC